MLDAAPNDVRDRLVQPADRCWIEASCRSIGPDPRSEERLVGVDVPQTCDPPLVEQDRLHRRPPALQHGRQGLGRKGRVERLGAERPQELGVARNQLPAAELPQVAPAEVVAAFEAHPAPLVRLRWRVGPAPHQPARHPEVRGPGVPVIQAEEEILPPAIDADDAPAAETLAEGLEGFFQKQRRGRRLDRHVGDPFAQREPAQVSADGFHLGKFGHIRKPTAWACAGATAPAYWCAMITHLAGRLARLDIAGPAVEVDVGGIRYEVLVPLFLWPEIERIAGEADLDDAEARPPIALHISYHASANNPVPVLVGFLRRAERDFFRKFVSVEGMGPAKAVRALTISVSAVARAIEQEDRALLTKLPGIGARQADKIIAALRGKVLAEAAMHDAHIAEPVDPAALERGRIAADAIAAITGLGYSRSEAKRWVEEALAADPSLDSVEALTLAVLRARGSERA